MILNGTEITIFLSSQFTLDSIGLKSSDGALVLSGSGQITASAAQITGKVTATSGEIGGFTIDADEIKRLAIIKKKRNRLKMNSIMIFLVEVMITKNSLRMRKNMKMMRNLVMRSFSIIHLERIIQRMKRHLMRFMIELGINSLIQMKSV